MRRKIRNSHATADETIGEADRTKAGIAWTLAPLVLVLAWCGCGSSVPNEREGKAALQQEIQRFHSDWYRNIGLISLSSKSLVRVVKFHKTNGAPLPMDSGYEINYDAEIEFLEDCYCEKSDDSRLGRVTAVSDWTKSEFVPKESSWPKVEKGERAKISGTVRLRKTEKGWMKD
jgi:hypothetical protein